MCFADLTEAKVIEEGQVSFNSLRKTTSEGLVKATESLKPLTFPDLNEETADEYFEFAEKHGSVLLQGLGALKSAIASAKESVSLIGFDDNIEGSEVYLPGLCIAEELAKSSMLHLCSWTALKIVLSKAASRCLPDAAQRAHLGINHFLLRVNPVK